MSRENTDKTEGLSPTEQKKADAAASAAGRAHPDKTDERDAIKSHEEGDERPKNSGDPNRTGSQQAKKQHNEPKEH